MSGFLAKRGANITQAHQYEDHRSGRFFMRYEFSLGGGGATASPPLSDAFAPIADSLEMTWRLVDVSRRRRVVILVSKFDHCLAYLLHRRKVGDLEFDLPCVISNHETLRELVEWYGVPFHHVPVPKDPAGREAAF
ncbi:MAG: formyltetrahydrofolate deformylase, partial [Opitutales bacterium]